MIKRSFIKKELLQTVYSWKQKCLIYKRQWVPLNWVSFIERRKRSFCSDFFLVKKHIFETWSLTKKYCRISSDSCMIPKENGQMPLCYRFQRPLSMNRRQWFIGLYTQNTNLWSSRRPWFHLLIDKPLCIHCTDPLCKQPMEMQGNMALHINQYRIHVLEFP